MKLKLDCWKLLMDDIEFQDNLTESIKNKTIEISANIEECKLIFDDNPYTLSLRQNGFDDEKEMKKFIKSCEILIRKCPEYKLWTDYIRETLGVFSCDITKEIHNECHCDIHHHPIPLYLIIKCIISEYINKNEYFCSADIMVKTLEVHFKNRIGYISLIRSLHEKFHNGFLQLPMSLVHGNYKSFINDYCGYMEDSEIQIVDNRLSITNENCGFEGYWNRNIYLSPEVEGVIK